MTLFFRPRLGGARIGWERMDVALLVTRSQARKKEMGAKLQSALKQSPGRKRAAGEHHVHIEEMRRKTSPRP